ncbi:hypothetical protein, partial [Parvibaculum sp.]|uniref:hypothetical protein n=1 Tax=Parvibaculum sp. TaxID=2024848 RepID=UPI003C76DEF3
AKQAASVIGMIRAMIGEMFGPIANIESEEATLLRGPEAKHDGEAILEALQRVHAALGAQTPPEGAETEAQGWRPIDTAPKGVVTEDAGCRGASEWFLARPSEHYRRHGAAPMVVIRRRPWPQDDSWSDNGETFYVPAYFDGWQPLPTPPVNQSEGADRG